MDKAYAIMIKDWHDDCYQYDEVFNNLLFKTRSQAEEYLNKLPKILQLPQSFIPTQKDGVHYLIKLRGEWLYNEYRNESDERKNKAFWESEANKWYYVEKLIFQ